MPARIEAARTGPRRVARHGRSLQWLFGTARPRRPWRRLWGRSSALITGN